MSWLIPLADVRLSAEQRAAALDVLDSGWLSMGPRTAAFESAFADAAGVPAAVCLGSATAGLILALHAAGVTAGDEVVLPSLTFVADANAARVLGARTVLVDVESVQRPIVDANAVLRAVTARTKAVIVVHYGGYCADIEALNPLRERGITIIEDASHAVGPIADSGEWMPFTADLAVFSFFANKNLAVGEGGMITGSAGPLLERTRSLRSHGMTTGTWDRHAGHASDYDVVEPGWNFRPQEIAAALGEAGLADLPSHNHARRRALLAYHSAFEETEVGMIFGPDDPSTGHLAVAILPPGRRPAVRAALADAKIQSSFHYPPIHRFSAYRTDPLAALPYTDAAADRYVTLPLHAWVTDDDVDRITEVVLKALRAG